MILIEKPMQMGRTGLPLLPCLSLIGFGCGRESFSGQTGEEAEQTEHRGQFSR